MKKLLFLFALVVSFGVAMAMSVQEEVTVNDHQISVVDDNGPEGENTATTEKSKAKSEGCSGTKSKAEGCSGSKAKAEGCDSKKSASAKKDCGSDCGGSKTAQK